MNDLFLQKEAEILAMAEHIMKRRMERKGYIRDPGTTTDYLKAHLADKTNEVFGVIFLDTRHGILACEEILACEDLHFGTIDGAEVHPRVIAKRALELNASAVILYHNHPSGNPLQSSQDLAVTARIKTCLGFFGIRVLDHVIVAGTESTSLASKGLL